MRPSQSARALRAIVCDLIETSDGARYFANRTSGMALRYDLGGAHPLVGHSVPDFEGKDGTRLNMRLRQGQSAIVDFARPIPLQALAERYRSRLDYVACNPHDCLGLSTLLVRPDGVVAWAASHEGDYAGAAAAASRWLGWQ